MDTVLILLFVVILFVAALMLFRALVYGRVPALVEPAEISPVEGPLVAEHLAAVIRIPTISTEDPAARDADGPSAFDELHETLARMYPRLHGALRHETINRYSALYTWPGRRGDIEPVLLCAHIDVVPVEASSLPEWTHPPFEGAIADGFVWGRGALDMKGSAIALFESIEGLIRGGYTPERTLYLAIGHDEEIGGWNGASCIAQLLIERDEHLAAVFDEGGGIMTGVLAGVKPPVALVGVTEKGFASVELKVEGRPGHSSLPPRHTAIGVLSRAITRLESSPLPARTYLIRRMFEHLAPFLPGSLRLVLANNWLLGGLIRKRMEAAPATNALVRTTMAATIFNAGMKDNVLPAQARAVINCRLLPGDTVEGVLEHVRRSVNDEAVQANLTERPGWNPAPISETDGPVYDSLSRTIRQVFPECAVAPYLTTGATDSRHYLPMTPNIYRFIPVMMDNSLLNTMHGTNERISIEALARMVQFYTLLIKGWTEVSL
jgi:carboxypeptidase PM20D1